MWDLGQLARAAEARMDEGALPMGVAAVGTDTRSLPPSSLFVALRGENFDGHRFTETAIKAGAAALMLDEEGSLQIPATSYP
ncbi:UDP-N-acetylmuramoyl-tripeptide--D-alanyl-D-alanine ligase, partial [Myxococcota bacterium]|nr:UDP-N-acetylmuramoyl-tripeptide--D-alanyl-D-alanine ligase [Myxococcota bacterium]